VTFAPGRRPRVVSLVPSATETLLALGADVVACTRFCNQSLPTVGGTKNPDVDAIVALAPDVVVVDTEENRREDAEALEAAGLRMVVTSVRSVDDALAVVGLLAAAAGTEVPVLERPGDVSGERVSAFVPIWRRPWMTVNGSTYGASLLRSIGIDLVTADQPTEYPAVDLNDIARLAPDVVLVPSEPYSFADAHVGELGDAFPAARILRVDGEDLFWWGIRTPAARRRLADQLAGDHPRFV
jgi:ABC-type Fe3+-hydroxamate transport system substrate-binding protein